MTVSESSNNLGSSYGVLELNQSSFRFALKFQNSILNNWTQPYFNITLYHVIQFRNTSSVYRLISEIPTKTCNKSDFGDLENEFLELQLDEALCPESGANLTLEGNYQENIFSYFQIALDICNDSSLCQNETAISDLSLSLVTIEFYISNNIINLQNIDNPISQHLVSDMHFIIDISKTFYKTADIFLSESILTLETGYFPSLISSEEVIKTFFFNSQDVREQIAIYDSQNASGNVANFYFRKGPVSYQYSRVLGDIIKELSYFAGIWSTCYVWLMFFISSYNKNYFINSLSNKLYNFPSQMRKKPNLDLKLAQSHEYKQAFINDSPDAKSFSQKIFEKIEVYLSYDKKNKMSFWKMWRFPIKIFFSYFGCSLDEKEKLLVKSEKNLKNDLDICNILKKLQEIEKIKDLLFCPEQQILLSFTPKPEILCAKEEKKSILSLKNLSKTVRAKKDKGRFLANEIKYDSIKPFEDLILAWKIVKNIGANQSWSINENLLRMFGEDIPKIMDLPDADIKKIKRRNAQFQQGLNIQSSIKSLTPKKIQKMNSAPESPVENKGFPLEIEKKDDVIENAHKNNEEEINILEEKEHILFNNRNKEIFNEKLYENLMEINQNIAKICSFDICDSKD